MTSYLTRIMTSNHCLISDYLAMDLSSLLLLVDHLLLLLLLLAILLCILALLTASWIQDRIDSWGSRDRDKDSYVVYV